MGEIWCLKAWNFLCNYIIICLYTFSLAGLFRTRMSRFIRKLIWMQFHQINSLLYHIIHIILCCNLGITMYKKKDGKQMDLILHIPQIGSCLNTLVYISWGPVAIGQWPYWVGLLLCELHIRAFLDRYCRKHPVISNKAVLPHPSACLYLFEQNMFSLVLQLHHMHSCSVLTCRNSVGDFCKQTFMLWNRSTCGKKHGDRSTAASWYPSGNVSF